MVGRRGWAVAGCGLGLLVVWAALGELELLGVATLLVGSVVFAIVLTRWTRPRVEVSRRLAPALVHEGDRAAVRVTITNPGRRRLADLTIVDEVRGLGDARFDVAALGAGESVEATYHILCRPRGVYDVGPTRVSTSDPLGLASVAWTGGARDRLIVYPETEELVGFPVTRGRDPANHASRPEFSHRGGEDFYTMREYRVGDDLRRVHWPSSAKRDELMIRQLETPWKSLALVMLDVRARAYETPDCFEKAVSGAASVVRHLAAAGFDAELWAGGTATVGIDRYASVMEALALVSTDSRIDVRAAAAHLARTGRGGALFLITGTPDADLLSVKQALSREYRSVVLMAAVDGHEGTTSEFRRAGAVTMSVPPDGSWATAWMQATSRTWHAVSAR
ncbi:MAG: DUF58 domain-containing protein [Acidimicrobiia bacterium]|jgi:uncharacterized protein (DUF58 family)